MTPEEIKELRLKLDLSQEEFAQLLRTTVVSVNRWERGKFRPSKIFLREMRVHARAFFSKK